MLQIAEAMLWPRYLLELERIAGSNAPENLKTIMLRDTVAEYRLDVLALAASIELWENGLYPF